MIWRPPLRSLLRWLLSVSDLAVDLGLLAMRCPLGGIWDGKIFNNWFLSELTDKILIDFSFPEYFMKAQVTEIC